MLQRNLTPTRSNLNPANNVSSLYLEAHQKMTASDDAPARTSDLVECLIALVSVELDLMLDLACYQQGISDDCYFNPDELTAIGFRYNQFFHRWGVLPDTLSKQINILTGIYPEALKRIKEGAYDALDYLPDNQLIDAEFESLFFVNQ